MKAGEIRVVNLLQRKKESMNQKQHETEEKKTKEKREALRGEPPFFTIASLFDPWPR
jgi:hypothetical protein